VFTYTATIRMRDIDVAGVQFFARYFALAHDAYEAFLQARGFSIAHITKHEPFLIPVVHAEADYKAPLWIGDQVAVRVRVEELRRRRFTMAYEILTPEGDLSCSIRTVHVVVDKAKERAVPLPERLVQALEGDVSI